MLCASMSYSVDLRERVVKFIEEGGKKFCCDFVLYRSQHNIWLA